MNVRLKYDLHFTAGLYHNNNLRMNNYSLRLWMTTNTDNSRDQNTSFERIKYFVYSQIDSTIFINSQEQEVCKQFAQAGLNITTMPGDPVDQLIGIMLFHKLNAIMEDRMILVETELASTYGENMTYLHSEGESTSGFEQPAWWTTADPTHSNVELPETNKVVAMTNTVAWRDVDLAWTDEPADDTAETDSGNFVVFADFRPADDSK